MFTHTMPGPAPEAGALVAGAVGIVDEVCAGGAGAVAGAGEGLLDLNQECLAGVGATVVGTEEVAAVVAGAVVVPAASFFLECLAGVGEVIAVVEDVAAAVVAGAAVLVVAASFFLECLCLAGDASGLAAGAVDWPSNEVVENPINAMIKPINLFIASSYWECQRGRNAKVKNKD